MFFTHTRGYRIGTCVIGFVCTEKTAKAPAAIGGIYFLRAACIRYRQKSMAGQKTLDEWCVFVRRGEERKNREKLAKLPLLTQKTF